MTNQEIRSKLNTLDLKAIDNNSQYYDLVNLYESVKYKLNKEQLRELAESVNNKTSKEIYSILNESYNNIYGNKDVTFKNNNILNEAMNLDSLSEKTILNESVNKTLGSVEDYLKQMQNGDAEKVYRDAKGNPNAEKAYKEYKDIKNESKERYFEPAISGPKEYVKKVLKGEITKPYKFQYLSSNGTVGEVRFNGTDYVFRKLDNGDYKVMTSKEAGWNWSETLYKDESLNEENNSLELDTGEAKYLKNKNIKYTKEELRHKNRDVYEVTKNLEFSTLSIDDSTSDGYVDVTLYDDNDQKINKYWCNIYSGSYGIIAENLKGIQNKSFNINESLNEGFSEEEKELENTYKGEAVRFNINGLNYKEAGEENPEYWEALDGETGIISSLEVIGNPNFKDCYWNIVLDNGIELSAISGDNLTLLNKNNSDMTYEEAKKYFESKGLNLTKDTYNLILKINGKDNDMEESLIESSKYTPSEEEAFWELAKKKLTPEQYKDLCKSLNKECDECITEDINNQTFGEKAWMLNQIISAMNNEGAYFGSWLYIWPDGESYEDCLVDFGEDTDYNELEETFIYNYETYHEDGLYNAPAEVVNAAHEWDKKLGLEPIENIK